MDAAIDTSADSLAAAIRERLADNPDWLIRPLPDHGVVELARRGPAVPPKVVAAAVTDDGHGVEVLAHAWRQALATGATLRVVHVWMGHGNEFGAIDLLLSQALYNTLDPESALQAEREVLHDDDPVRALQALSKEVDLLVVAAAGKRIAPDRPLGGCVDALIGQTACPLTIVIPSMTPAWPGQGANLDMLQPGLMP
ncbi:universal stress protein [Actinoplanes regularis]|uniref:universal stress protein n=1 Tax=Actinoplanes regularis TaxID=52697 RepID=UPI0024A0CD2F|nr:universal stress protein [Actinoplanes regularis]GLW34666.1 hypothetical protein Areg01_76030 [Actinoplanes regularis]